jgi:small subunit ribosomal protein S20
MANIKSQIKRNRQSERQRVRNKGARSELKTRTVNAMQAAGGADGPEALRLAVKRIDQAASKGLIHKNTAARRKSRLMRGVSAAGGAAPTG